MLYNAYKIIILQNTEKQKEKTNHLVKEECLNSDDDNAAYEWFNYQNSTQKSQKYHVIIIISGHYVLW